MPFRIQRVPRGLNELLNIFGGGTPTELEDRVRSTLDTLQCYGMQQRQVFGANNAALAENGSIVFVPSTVQWMMLFGVTVTVIKTATATALRAASFIRYNADLNQEAALASDDLGPFGATETGAATVVFRCPFPLLLPPNTSIGARLQILGTDATANVTIGADFGLL